MSAAAALTLAADLVARFGHDHRSGISGCELTGFSIPGAIARAAADLVAADTGNEFARMRGWVIERAAVSYVVQVLGYDPDEYSPCEARDRVARAADGVRLSGLGDRWALAVLDAAATLAAASAPGVRGTARPDRTRLLTLLTLPVGQVA